MLLVLLLLLLLLLLLVAKSGLYTSSQSQDLKYLKPSFFFCFKADGVKGNLVAFIFVVITASIAVLVSQNCSCCCCCYCSCSCWSTTHSSPNTHQMTLESVRQDLMKCFKQFRCYNVAVIAAAAAAVAVAAVMISLLVST